MIGSVASSEVTMYLVLQEWLAEFCQCKYFSENISFVALLHINRKFVVCISANVRV